MEALRFSFRDRTLDLVRMEVPELSEPDMVLIKVAYAGICGSDLHILAGNYPCNRNTEITLGHELSGTIEEIGIDVMNFQQGDKVIVDPNKGCKRCVFCHGGKPHFCRQGCTTNTIGIYKDGGWANYVLCPEDQVHKLPQAVTLMQGVLAEPMSCIAHAWDLLDPICLGDKVLVLGAGMAGVLFLCLLHLHGHKKVTMSEPNATRLELVKKLNTGYTLLSPDTLKRNQDAEPESWMFDVIIDCSGNAPALEHAITLLNFGGKVCVFGVASPKSRISISPFDIFWKEIKIIGSNINPYTFQKSMNILGAMGKRYLNYNSLGIKTFELNQYKEAIDMIKGGTIAKAVFKLM